MEAECAGGLRGAVASARWLYDGTVELPVGVVGLPYVSWFEMAKDEGTLAVGESPSPPARDGLLYYVRFADAGGPPERTWVASRFIRRRR
jgi:hypothetical protein